MTQKKRDELFKDIAKELRKRHEMMLYNESNMNIFEGAKFGDIFITKDGTKNSFCSFTKIGSDTLARLYREGWGAVIFYLDGQVHSGVEFGKGIDFTIIGKESINEEELDRLAMEYIKSKKDPAIRVSAYNAYRVGYRKAKGL